MNLAKSLLHIGLCILAATGIAKESENATVFRKKLVYPAHISILITRKRFNTSDHKIDTKHWRIDGKRPYGVDGGSIPEYQIDRFQVTFAGETVIVPRSLYSDCFTPVLEEPDAKVSYEHL